MDCPWVGRQPRSIDAFKGCEVATTISAAAASIGVLPLPQRLAPAGLVEVGDVLGSPDLPPAKAAMLTCHVELQKGNSACPAISVPCVGVEQMTAARL